MSSNIGVKNNKSLINLLACISGNKPFLLKRLFVVK